MAKLSDLPPEILRLIAQLLYLDHLPRSIFRCIDPHGLPSTYENGRLISSTQAATQWNLYSFCLVNHAFYHAARPLLWRRLQITLPYSFLLLLRSLGASRLAQAYEDHHHEHEDGVNQESEADEERPQEQEGQVTRVRQKTVWDLEDEAGFNAMLAAVGLARATGGSVFVSQGGQDLQRRSSLRGQDLANSKKGTADEEDENRLELVWTEDERKGVSRGRYRVTFKHDHPDVGSNVHRYPRVLDFSTFRTQGMRRTIGESESARFVTPFKLLALITSVSEGLMAFGASSTMDSALSFEVLEALLFRDGEVVRKSGRLRGVSVERRKERNGSRKRRLQSLDLCNCTSSFFEAALLKFVKAHLMKFSGRSTQTVFEELSSSEAPTSSSSSSSEDGEEERGRPRSRSRGRSTTRSFSQRPSQMSRSMSTGRYGDDDEAPSTHPARATFFPSVQRLGMANIHFNPEIISPFILAFPKLTHLDLSGTKADAALLAALGASPTIDLQSLSLARCSRLTSESITDLLVDSPVCANLTEISLEGTLVFPTPLTPEDLKTIITTSPCMRSGRIRYLDLGGCGVKDEMLDTFLPQACLLDLGLSATPHVSLEKLAQFLQIKAPNVQVLELSESCSPPGTSLNIVRLNTVLLEPCARTPPMSLSEQLVAMGFAQEQQMSSVEIVEEAWHAGKGIPPSAPAVAAPRRAPTNLRVVGLAPWTLRSVGGALGSWRVILGAGRRGWLVDVSAGPNPEAVDEALEGHSASSGAPDASRRQWGADMRRAGSFTSARPRTSGSYEEEREVRDRGRKRRGGGAGFLGSWEPETPPQRSTSHSKSPAPPLSSTRLAAAMAASASSSSPLSSSPRGANLRSVSLRRATSQSHSRSRSAAGLRRGQMLSTVDDNDVDATVATTADDDESSAPASAGGPRPEIIRDLVPTHPRTLFLKQLADAKGHVPGSTGWHSRKMEVLLGYGLLGRESGSYAFAAYQA